MFEDSIPHGVLPASPEESMRAHMDMLRLKRNEEIAAAAAKAEQDFRMKLMCSTTENPYDTQVGGDHYAKMAIQPMEYSMANGLDALQHTIVKYVSRFRDKNGIEDLEKARHCIDMLIQFEKNKGA